MIKGIFENKEIKHVILPNMEYIQFKRLLEYPELKHAYILKSYDRNFRMGKDFWRLEEVKKNLKEVTMQIGIDYEKIVRPDFEHTNHIFCVESLGKERPELKKTRFQNTDGLITNQKEIALMATNADCNLLMIYDPMKKVLANVHARLERYLC